MKGRNTLRSIKLLRDKVKDWTTHPFKDGEISNIKYEDTEMYAVTKNFLNNKEKMFKELFT